VKQRILIGTVAAVALAAAGSAFAAAPTHVTQAHAVRANSQTFTDATGDATNGAPDVSIVTVSNDDHGQVNVAMTLANRTALTDQDFILAQLDTDGNLSDGIGGADYLAGFVNGSGAIFSGAGGNLVPIAPASFSSSFANGVQTFSVNIADIGNPTQIAFAIDTSGDEATTIGERAPDASVWSYSVMVTPAGGTGPTGSGGPGGAPNLVASKAALSKAAAGKRFTASTVVTNNGEGVQGTVTCSARLGGKALPGGKASAAASGKSSCSWRLPAAAHGKSLAGRISVSYEGASVARSFSTKVKK